MAEHTFTMDLTPTGLTSCVLLDGDDISNLLRGVVVRSSVTEGTFVELETGKGQRAHVTARLPEARIVVIDPGGASTARLRLAPWLHHHAECARVTDAGACTCGLNEALEELTGV